MNLTDKVCIACEGGIPPLTSEQIAPLMKELKTEWTLHEAKKISKNFTFKDFKEAMIFINAIADLAEKEGHHPDIYISYNKVEIYLTTHAIQGLSENDFILAAKIEEHVPLKIE